MANNKRDKYMMMVRPTVSTKALIPADRFQPGVRTKDGLIFTAVGLELEERRWGSGNRMITYWNSKISC
jgi:hypothetical protein